MEKSSKVAGSKHIQFYPFCFRISTLDDYIDHLKKLNNIITTLILLLKQRDF